ncbi:hypothetical protein HWV62_36867 [Athelia sp. TMB]|nr:hypothetical protein HWV62_36867 [Athelia sp. TMB]
MASCLLLRATLKPRTRFSIALQSTKKGHLQQSTGRTMEESDVESDLSVSEESCESEQQESVEDNMCHISKLPAETLMSIFSACVRLSNASWEGQTPSPETRWTSDVMSERSPPLVFLAVCRQWRHLAMGNPALWSTLRPQPRLENLNDIAMMSRWLQYANQQPLTVQLFAGDDWEIADLAVDVLMEHQAHWFRIDLFWEITDDAPLLAHAFAPAQQAPLLQTFRLFSYLDPDPQDAVDAQLGKLFSGSPDLQVFEWSHIIPYASDSSLIHLPGVPLSNLRHLKLGCRMVFSCCIEIMRRMPLLERCELLDVWHGDDDHDHTTASALHLQHLHSLCIKTDGDMSGFLDELLLPALRRIEVVFRLYHPDPNHPDGPVDDERQDVFEPWPHAEFLSFLQRSACPLEELDLVTSVSAAELLQYLPVVSSTLHTLCLRGKLGWTCVDHRALSLLTILPGGSGDVICPNLHTIRLDDCIVAGELPIGSMADMVQSRLIFAAASQRPLTIYLAAIRLAQVICTEQALGRKTQDITSRASPPTPIAKDCQGKLGKALPHAKNARIVPRGTARGGGEDGGGEVCKDGTMP